MRFLSGLGCSRQKYTNLTCTQHIHLSTCSGCNNSFKTQFISHPNFPFISRDSHILNRIAFGIQLGVSGASSFHGGQTWLLWSLWPGRTWFRDHERLICGNGSEPIHQIRNITWCTQSFNIYQSGLQNQGWFQQKMQKMSDICKGNFPSILLKKGALSFCNHVDPSLHWQHWFVDRRASTKRNPRVGSSAGEWVSHACYGWIGWMNGCENRTLHGWVWQVMSKEIPTSSWMAYI